MQLLSMTFAPIKNEQCPATITVEMGVREAALIAKLFGRLSKTESHGAEVDNCLVADVFNRYWDEGVDEALIDLALTSPPEFKRDAAG